MHKNQHSFKKKFSILFFLTLKPYKYTPQWPKTYPVSFSSFAKKKYEDIIVNWCIFTLHVWKALFSSKLPYHYFHAITRISNF